MTANINGMFARELEPNTIIAGCINIFENAWPTPDKTIADVEAACSIPDSNVYWSKAEIVDLGQRQNIRTNSVMAVSHLADIADNQILQSIHNQFYMLLLSATLSYANRYKISETFFHEGYNMLKYRPGEEYKHHYDTGTSLGRVISAILYLNSNYSGGELEFPNFGVTIKPEPGMLVMFPSNFAYSHIAKPVISGEKYAIVTWIKDRKI